MCGDHGLYPVPEVWIREQADLMYDSIRIRMEEQERFRALFMDPKKLVIKSIEVL